MIGLTLTSLWSHKRRVTSTMLAVCLGVAFVSGTLVLGDTMRNTFKDLFESANAQTAAAIQAPSIEAGEAQSVGALDASLLDTVQAVDGVKHAVPEIAGYGSLVGRDGKPIGGFGPPTAAGNWVDDPELSAYRIVEGRAPQTNHEVVINRGAARAGNLAVGDTTKVHTPDAVEVTIVGISTFGDVDSAGGVTWTAFTLAGAQQHVLHQPGKIGGVRVSAVDGVSQDELATRLRSVVPSDLEVKTGAQLTAESRQSIDEDFLTFFTTFLLVFAGIALVVATFSIYNTFSILVAQRTRESALLRALGASRRQVLGSTLLETVLVGVVASVVGLFAGIGIAAGLKAMLAAFGFNIPATGLALTGGTVVASLSIGVIVAMVAGVMPAIRSSRVAPLAALRDAAIERPTPSIVRLAIGAVAAVAGIGIVAATVTSGADDGLPRAGLGAALILFGMVALGPAAVRVAGPVLGWPFARTRGVPGELARENAVRNPKRSSGSAAALMIGVGVVTLFTVLATSLSASVEKSVGASFGGDFVVQAGPGWAGGGMSRDLAQEIDGLPEVGDAVGIGMGAALIGDDAEMLSVADTTKLERVFDIDVSAGTATLGADELGVASGVAKEKGWTLGSEVPLTFVDGTTTTFRVASIYEAADLTGPMLISRDGWGERGVQDRDVVVLASAAPGTSLADAKTAVERVASGSAGATVMTRAEFVESVGANINQTLGLVYVLLFLAIVIALMGIANTLSLSIHERTRELGLLRAVGSTRRQIRTMVRSESVIISLFGTAGGIGVGFFLGWALVKAGEGSGIGVFTARPAQLAVVFVVGAVAGVLASLRPARKASRLDVLQAIAA